MWDVVNKISNLLWGGLLVVVGVLFGLNALNITNINVFLMVGGVYLL